MIWTPKNSKGMKLVDAVGTEIPTAFYFNDETFQVKLYISGFKNGKTRLVVGGRAVVQATTIIPGAKMVPKAEDNK